MPQATHINIQVNLRFLLDYLPAEEVGYSEWEVKKKQESISDFLPYDTVDGRLVFRFGGSGGRG